MVLNMFEVCTGYNSVIAYMSVSHTAMYQMGLSFRQLGTFCSLIFQIKVIPEIQNAYLFSYIGVSLSLFLYLFCPF